MTGSPRVRITAAFVAATVISLLLVGLVVQGALRDRLTDSLDDVLEDRATATARLLVDRGDVRPGLTEGLDDPGESFTQVIGPDGKLRLSSPRAPAAAGARPRTASARAAAGGIDVRLDDVRVDSGRRGR